MTDKVCQLLTISLFCFVKSYIDELSSIKHIQVHRHGMKT